MMPTKAKGLMIIVIIGNDDNDNASLETELKPGPFILEARRLKPLH